MLAMKYAINLADLITHHANFPLMALIHPVIRRDAEILHCERRCVDGDAVALECDEERAAAVVKIIRMRLKRHELRLYTSRTGKGSWRRV